MPAPVPVILSVPVKSWFPENFNVPAETLKGPVPVGQLRERGARPADECRSDRAISAVDIGHAGAELDRACPADDLIAASAKVCEPVKRRVAPDETAYGPWLPLDRLISNVPPVTLTAPVLVKLTAPPSSREMLVVPVDRFGQGAGIGEDARAGQAARTTQCGGAAGSQGPPGQSLVAAHFKRVVTAVVPVPVIDPPLQVIVAVVRVPVPLKLPPDRRKASAVVLLSPRSSEPEEISGCRPAS